MLLAMIVQALAIVATHQHFATNASPLTTTTMGHVCSNAQIVPLPTRPTQAVLIANRHAFPAQTP